MRKFLLGCCLLRGVVGDILKWFSGCGCLQERIVLHIICQHNDVVCLLGRVEALEPHAEVGNVHWLEKTESIQARRLSKL